MNAAFVVAAALSVVAFLALVGWAVYTTINAPVGVPVAEDD